MITKSNNTKAPFVANQLPGCLTDKLKLHPHVFKEQEVYLQALLITLRRTNGKPC